MTLSYHQFSHNFFDKNFTQNIFSSTLVAEVKIPLDSIFLSPSENYSESNISRRDHLNGAINIKMVHIIRKGAIDCGLAMNDSNLYLDMFHSLSKQSIEGEKNL